MRKDAEAPTVPTAIAIELGSCTDALKRRTLSLLHSRLEINNIMRSFRNSLHDPCTIATNRALSNTQWHKTSGMQENMRATTPLELESRAQPGHQSKLLPALFLVHMILTPPYEHQRAPLSTPRVYHQYIPCGELIMLCILSFSRTLVY